tara:strand:+ start:430 stop:606 length:177 start_codon:yes stop_codon:yes gene_type:complete
MVESPILEKPRPGLIRQELVSYENRDGILYKKTEIRNYSKDGDYQDHYESVYIGEMNE